MRGGQVSACSLLEQGEASTDLILQTCGRHAWAIHQWEIGNIGEAFRYLSRTTWTVRDVLTHGREKQLPRDLQLLGPVMVALMTALHGDVDESHALLETIEAATGDDPYVITVWAAFAVTIAVLANDPARARRAAERGIAVDPQFSFVFLGVFPRLARCSARAVTGEDPASAAAEAQAIIAAALADPPRSGLALWNGMLGEMWLVAGKLDASAAALDRAESCFETYGERYAEGLVLVLRARLMQTRGEPAVAVRAAAERACRQRSPSYALAVPSDDAQRSARANERAWRRSVPRRSFRADIATVSLHDVPRAGVTAFHREADSGAGAELTA